MKKVFTKPHFYIDFLLFLCFLAGMFWAVCSPEKHELSVHIYYREFQTGITSKIFWNEGDGFSEECSTSQVLENREVILEMDAALDDLKGLRFDGSDRTDFYSIAQISVLVDGISCGDMRAEQMAESFGAVNAEIEISEETDALAVYPENADSGLVLNDDGVWAAARENAAQMQKMKTKNRVTALILLFVCGLMCVHHSRRITAFFKSIFGKDENGKRDIFTYVFSFVLVAGVGGVALIGLFSALGLHPDEWDVKACLDYGMTHFLPPDMRNAEVAGTYSGYGYTKLDNTTWYFFLAGKIALLFKTLFYGLAYYRVPNILMFAAMIWLAMKNIRKKSWLMLCVGISAQAWYIFSYTTADALDYFCAFLVILLITDEDSLLFRTLDLGMKSWRFWLNCALLGTLFGFVFLGKPYYWSILGLAFLVLLLRLAENWKDEKMRKGLFARYFAILSVFLLCVGFRYSFDLIHYGFDKASVELEMDILYADHDKNPTTPEEEWCSSYHMMERGYSLKEMFAENQDWFSMTYKSFCGFIDDHETGSWYYWAMGICYAFLYLCLLYGTFFEKTTVWDKCFFGVGSLLMIAALGASILNSWMIDSQAQGRYLLPVLLVAGFMASRVPKLAKKWYFQAGLALAGILTAGYFVLVGAPMFISRADLPF